MIIYGEFPVCRQAGIWPKSNKKETHEMSHDNVYYQPGRLLWRIPCLPTRRHVAKKQ